MARSRIDGHTAFSASYAGLITAAAAAIFSLFIAAPLTASAAVGVSAEPLSEDDETCLSCHDSEGMEKYLANGEILSLHIRGGPFANSIHSWVGCAGCHGDVDLEIHPGDKPIETRHAYSVEVSQVCAECHSDESLKDGPAHHARVSTTAGPACAECHDAHAITPISEWKAGIGETAYCLTCHGQALSVRLDSGESFALSVDEAVLRNSVHPDHECADCHTGFSTETHETGDLREHARKCHCADAGLPRVPRRKIRTI